MLARVQGIGEVGCREFSIEDTVLNKTTNHQHIRVAVVGNVDAGKSTLIGTLVSSTPDDGRGLARSKITKHKHELVSGRTSTITTHLLGLDESNFETVTGSYQKVVLQANRLVTLMDLAGHERYLKTTVGGLARGMSDYALILVNAGQPPTHMTIEHLKLCVRMNIPVVILLTKTDRCPDENMVRDTQKELFRTLKSPQVGRRPFAIKNADDVKMVTNKMGYLVPTILVSCTNGNGLDLLQMLLCKLPQRRRHAKKQLDKPFEYLVEEIFQVPGVGTVLSGFVTRGTWERGESIYVGPLKDGTVMEVVPKSVHVAQTTVSKVWAGHQVCFALPKLCRVRRKLLGKGMVARKNPFTPSHSFMADIHLTKGSTVTVQTGKFDTTLHILHMKQSAKVVDIQVDGEKQSVIRQGESARVTFRFLQKPSYIRSGMKIILRSGHIIGFGTIIVPT